ncbi:MAG: hypothetical protein JSW00_03420 [Thermoplasmata archaeon]|nr:MAG: hypothetical protein JSW00_03420 [Thermoplasmata archaeon]
MQKFRNTISGISKRADKFVPKHDLFFKSMFTLFFVILVALQPALLEGNISDKIPKAYHDFGVYEGRNALLSNISAIEESQEIAEIAEGVLDVTIHDNTDDIQFWDGVSDAMSFRTLDVPEMEMPGIIGRAQDFGVKTIIGTIAEGRSYYIYANSSDNPDGTWVTHLSVGDMTKRPVIHSKLVSNEVVIEPLNPTPVDIDSDGTDDIEVELVIEATVDGGLSTNFSDPLGNIPIPSIPPIPNTSDNPPRVRITYPPTSLWIVGRSLISDTWRIGGWTWEFDLETDSPEIEKVVVAFDDNGENATWEEATLSKIINPPNILLNWFRWTYDINLRDFDNGLHTVYVRAYEGDDFTEDSVTILVSNPVYKGMRLLVNVDRINSAFDQASEINILRPLSHGGNQYIWSLGMNFDDIPDSFKAYLSPDALSLNNHLPTPGSPLLGSVIVEYLEGPFHLGWDASATPPGLGFCFSHAQVDSTENNLTEATWLKLNFTGSDPPQFAEIMLSLNTTMQIGLNFSADANLLSWQSDKETNLQLVYHDERDKDTIHMIATVFGLPRNLEIELENQSSIKPYDVYTSIHLNASSGIAGLVIKEYIFEDEKLHIGLGVNISNLPKNFFLNGTYSAFSIKSPKIQDIAGDFMWPYLWDVISMLVGRIFVQVAERVVSLPLRFLDSGLLSGEYILSMPEGEKIDKLSFYLTDYEYPQSDGNFLCFYSTSDTNLSLSGRFFNIQGLHALSNESGILLDAELITDQKLTIINCHGTEGKDFEYVHLSNIPSHFIMSINESNLNYSANENIDWLEFLSNNSGTHIYIKITDMPKKLNFVQGESSIMLDTHGEGITSLEFVVSDSRAKSLDGNYLMLISNPDMKMLSGRISNIKRLYYSNALPQTLALSLKGGYPLQIAGRIESQNIQDNLVLDAQIANLPDELTISVPNDRFSASFDILNITSVSGVKDLVGKFASLSDIGNTFLGLMVNITELLTTELSELVGGVFISYSFEEEYNMDLMARIEFGDVSQIGDCIWTHGISMKSNEEGSIFTKVFLTGLPQSAELRLELAGDRRVVDFTLINFQPRYDFLIFDVKAMDDIEVLFYIDDIAGKIHEISFNSSFNISFSNTIANLDCRVRSDEDLGSIFLEGRIDEPYPTQVEMYLSSVPKNLDTRISAQNDISLSHNASRFIEHLLLNIEREIEDSWYNGTVIAHEIPTNLDIAFKTNTKYTKDTPLVGMPGVNVKTDHDTLDLYMNMDGRAFGRRGSYEVYVENLRSGLSAGLIGDSYKIRAENLDHFVLVSRDMPIMPMYHLKSMSLCANDLKSLDLKVQLAANSLPVIQLDNARCKDLRLALSHDMDFLGARLSPNIVLSEATFYQSSNSNLLILFKSPTHINGISTSLEKGRTVVLVPNLFMTLVVTFAPLFVVLHVLLFALWGMVKIRQGMKKGYEENPEDEEPQDDKANNKSNPNDKTQSTKEDKKWGKRKKMVVVVFLLIILASLLYYFMVPWVELSVSTSFSETPSGIFVVCEASNTGTVMVEDLSINVNVYNSSGVLMNTTFFSSSILKRWQYAHGYVQYFGDQFESYKIEISVYFKANGKGYRDTFSHEASDYMRLAFEKKVP